MSAAERTERTVTDLQRTVQSIHTAMGALRAAYDGNDLRRWEAARSSLEIQFEGATRTYERAAIQASHADPETATRLNEVSRALATARQAPELGHAPTGFTTVASEAALIGLLTNPVEGGAHPGFAKREAEFMQVVDDLEPQERRELSRRLRVRLPQDPLATAFATRFTGERQQRLLTHVAALGRRPSVLTLLPAPGTDAPTAVAQMPEPPTADARVRTALVSDSETMGAAHLLETLLTLDQPTRADLLARYDAYRPGAGDEIAARLRRLDGAIQRDVISTLRDPGVGLMVPATTGLQVGMDEGATLQRPAMASPLSAQSSPVEVASRASLRAAAYEFDAGVAEIAESAELARTGVTSNLAARTEYHARTGLQHLTYVRDLVGSGSSGARDRVALGAQMDDTARALDGFVTAAMGTAPADLNTSVLDGVMLVNAVLRREVGMPESVAVASRTPESGVDDYYEASVIAPALELGRSHAEALYGTLSGDSSTDTAARALALSAGASAIEPHLRYVIPMLRRLDSQNRGQHAEGLERMTAAVMKVERWVIGRPASATLLPALSPVERLLDAARSLVALPPLADRLVEGLTPGEDQEERAETLELEAAKDNLRDSYDRLKGGCLAGMREFEKHVAIKEVTPPPFWAEFGKAILVAAIGHVTGGLGGIVVSRALSSLANTATKASIEGIVANLMVDGTQGIASKVADDAFAGSSAEVARARLFAGFVRGMDLHAEDLAKLAKARVNDMVLSQRVGVADLDTLRRAVDEATADAHSIVLQNAARAWATLLAKCALGVDRPGGQREEGGGATNLTDYFGSREGVSPRYTDSVRAERRTGAVDGMANITVVVPEAAADPAALQVASLEVSGLDRYMTRAMIMKGDGFCSVAELAMPTLISVWVGSSQGQLAIDERGQIRDILRWDTLRRWNADRTARAAHPRFYEEPASLWRTLGAMTLSSKVVG